MAEHGAHLASLSVSEDISRPGVFEVLAQQNLMSTIRPAMHHAIRVFAEKYPEYLSKLFQNYDELFLLLDTVVQWYYLRRYGASFAENFYDLKRVASCNHDVCGLSVKLQLRALACLVLIPYVQHKCDSLFEELRYREGAHGRGSFMQRGVRLRQRFVRLYLSLYPYIHSAWQTLSLAYQMNYMLRRGRWHSPSMHLSGTELVSLSPEDDFSKSNSTTSFDWSNSSIFAKCCHLAKFSFNTAAAGLSHSLSVGVFFLQFLEWWYASDHSAPSLTSLPVPCPPQPQHVELVGHNTCPLCMQERTNSTALSVSGYVFCYPCIIEHVRKQRCCPVTGYPATSDHMVKIYEQDF